jgi:hypothetical protein
VTTIRLAIWANLAEFNRRGQLSVFSPVDQSAGAAFHEPIEDAEIESKR